MRIDQKNLERFQELLDQGGRVMQTRTPSFGYGILRPGGTNCTYCLGGRATKTLPSNNLGLRPRAMIGEMNDALAKSGLYNNILKTRTTALASIRNQATHGQWKEFTVKDVDEMTSWMRIFMENSFGETRLSIQ